MEIALVNEELFKANSPIKDDTFISKFVPYIILAQKMYIEKILGRAVVSQLQEQIKAAEETPEADPYPISPENQALLLMIAPPLSFYAVYQGLPFHWAAIVNKGVTMRNSENSDAAGLKDIAQLRRWLRDDAEELTRQLIEYLCECGGTSYPLWSPRGYCGSGCGCDSSSTSPFDTGIFIPNRR